MSEDSNIGSKRSGESRLGLVVAPLLSVLVSMPGCARNTAKNIANTANNIQNTANNIQNTANAVNAATDAVGKTLHLGASTSGGVGSLPPPQGNPHSGPASACVIDDMADGNNQILPAGGRRGFWYSYVDKAGSSISPPAGATFVMSPSGASNISAFAAHFLGNISTGRILYAGVGFTFTDPKGAYDASRYAGVSFWAKAEAGSTKNVRFKISDVNTDPDGKVCTGCYNDFGSDLVLTEQWHQYVIRFPDMTQLPGWGNPRAASIAQSALYGVQWQVSSPGTGYDMAVSNVSFIGCP